MSLIDCENINMKNEFISDIQQLIFSPNNDSFSNYSLIESKEELPLKQQQIKFILTKQDTPNNLLQKKTSTKASDSSTDSENSNNGRWTKEEQKRFAEAILKHRNNWKNIQNYVSSRNITQIRSHAQKFLMKLKENKILKDKGLKLNSSWTKVMTYLFDTLTYDELKEVLFSVEQTGNKLTEVKNNKITKKNKQKQNKKSSLDNEQNSEETDSKISFDPNEEQDKKHYCYKYSNCGNNLINLDDEEENDNKNQLIITQEEEDKEILQKLIECFNSPSWEISLNSSFEEHQKKDDANENGYDFLNEIQNKYNNSYI
jgi:SHAQKYF class myb-like DNA-binding protein